MIRGISCSLLLLALFTGCSSNEVQEIKEQKEENQMASILGQLLQEKTSLNTYRSVMEQLNSYYDHQGIDKTIAMPPADEAMLRQLLSELKGDFDKARRVDEVKNRFFNTLSDASYLDACLLFEMPTRLCLTIWVKCPPRAISRLSMI